VCDFIIVFSDDKMEVTETKVVVLILLGTIKLVFGLAPLGLARAIKKQKNDWWIKKLIGIVLCIGGGVLLSTVFIHMLKEVREYMDRAIEMRMLPKADYPFAELIICMGFLMILLVESIVHKFFGGHGHGVSDNKEEGYLDSPPKITLKIPRVTGSNPVYDNQACQEETPRKLNAKASGASPYFANKRQEAMGGVFTMSSTSITSIDSYSSATDSLAIKISKTPGKAKQTRDTRKVLSSLRGFLVVAALSVHSLFEGMAVGLEETTAGVWQLFMAISIHSTAIVFCIGTEMVSSGTRKARLVLSMLVLSIVTPLGVVMGLLLTIHAQTETGAHVLLVGVLQGMAGGTLLYITFFEVLSRDKLTRYGMSGLMGALTIMFGFTVMAALNGLGGHSHGGGGGHQGHQGHGHAEQVKIHSDGGHINEHRDHNHGDHADIHHNPYDDHFHEEYDLDHGDHVHHIEPHDQHNFHSEDIEDDDFVLDTDDYVDFNRTENYHEMETENHDLIQKEMKESPSTTSRSALVPNLLSYLEHDRNSILEHEHGHSHHEEGHGEEDHEHDMEDNIFDYGSLVT